MNLLVVLAAFLYANLIECGVHKYLFHNRGKKANSWFAFHLRDHHATARLNSFIDHRTSGREIVGITLLSILHLPVLLVSPLAYGVIASYGIAFILVHNYQHRNPEFTNKYFWWHWNHHMKNPNKNWGVVSPAVDFLFRTLER